MKRNCASSKVYKNLCGGKHSADAELVIYALFICLIVVIAIFGLVFGIAQKEYGTAFCALAIAVLVLAVCVPYAKKTISMKRRVIKKRMAMLDALSDEEFEQLDAEAEGAEYFFNTFKFLDCYLYVPKARLLIEYGNILDINTIVHSTNGITDAVYVEITDEDANKCKFSVKKWKDFLKLKYMFDDMLVSKCNGEKLNAD